MSEHPMILTAHLKVGAVTIRAGCDVGTAQLAIDRYSTQHKEAELATLRARAERAEAALLSIARNTCCGGCLEAARVARTALGSEKLELPPETPEP